ncbi:MAG: hypothetical protein WD317_01725 [Balneolaceae bacterium]
MEDNVAVHSATQLTVANRFVTQSTTLQPTKLPDLEDNVTNRFATTQQSCKQPPLILQDNVTNRFVTN